MSEIIAAFLGAAIALLGEFGFNYKRARNEEDANIRVVYYDLISIEKYVKELIDFKKHYPQNDIRFNNRWQEPLKDITFFNTLEIRLIYDIYDAVYDYNTLHRNRKLKEKTLNKVQIYILINDIKYINLKKRIEKRIKIK